MMRGRLIGIARRPRRLVPMQEVAEGRITVEAGLDGDFKGGKYPRRQITVLAREAWEAALAEVGGPLLPWTARRANLLVEGIVLPTGIGSLLRIGPVRLEVTAETYPCHRMEEARAGLRRALAKEGRGGVTCRVLEGGALVLGDEAEVVLAARRLRPDLPG
jgi:MOSC domain-containing protein YiiM